jgi:glyoxylate reductase
MKGDLLDALPSTLKMIAIPSVGYDHYDTVALKARGIILCNSPGLSADTVADLGLHLALSVYRYTTLFEHTLRTQKHTIQARKAAFAFDHETGIAPTTNLPEPFAYGHIVGSERVQMPHGKRVGIAGFGAIGKALARRLHVLGMKIHYLKRSPVTAEEQKELGFRIVYHESFDSLAKVSDLLVLTLPLSPETTHILNSSTIAFLPSGAKVVNIGRGPLIDQKALLDGLRSGKISSAGLDVYEYEPTIEPELLERWDVTLLPHIGGCSTDAAHASMVNCMDCIEDCLKNGGNGLFPVNL